MDAESKSSLRQHLLAALTLVDGEVVQIPTVFGVEKPSQGQPSQTTLPGLSVPPGKLVWGAKVSQTFRDRVKWIAHELGFDPNWLMACMAFETGRRFTANVKNPASTATGLIQFMRQTAIDLGTSVEALAKMTAEDQLNYVYKYFRDRVHEKGPILSLEDCYMAILWPNAIGKPSTHPLFVNDVNKARDSYDVNAGLDANKDNVVTKAEAAAKVRAMYVEGAKEENLA